MSIHDRNPDAILFAGDWHGTIQQAERALIVAMSKNIHTVIQLGDFGIWHDDQHGNRYLKFLNELAKKQDITIYFVDGNHEDFNHLYKYPLQDDGTRRVRSNIFHLPRGFRFTWGGVRFVALGGAHSVDKDKRRINVSWWPQEWTTDADIDAVVSKGEADVMLMHDSPHGAPNPVLDDPRNDGHLYFSLHELREADIHRYNLRRAAEAVDPVAIFHGHYHRFGIGAYEQPSGTLTTVYSLDEGGASNNKHTRAISLEDLQLMVSANRSID